VGRHPARSRLRISAARQECVGIPRGSIKEPGLDQARGISMNSPQARWSNSSLMTSRGRLLIADLGSWRARVATSGYALPPTRSEYRSARHRTQMPVVTGSWPDRISALHQPQTQRIDAPALRADEYVVRRSSPLRSEPRVLLLLSSLAMAVPHRRPTNSVGPSHYALAGARRQSGWPELQDQVNSIPRASGHKFVEDQEALQATQSAWRTVGSPAVFESDSMLGSIECAVRDARSRWPQTG
jgi:hypothetical protein